jgi:FKBP-type peptidyl-prolyl cis-trans isomerase (trigger factor)
MVENEIERSIDILKQNLLRTGTRFESAGISEEKMRHDLRTGAEETVKEKLIVGKIADMEDIRVDDSDIRDGFRELAAQTGNDPTKLQQYYEKNNLMDSFGNRLLIEKVLNHLVKGDKISEVQEIYENGLKERKGK